MAKAKRIKKNFTYRDGKKLLDCIRGNYTTSMFAAYLGVRDNREIQILKQNGKELEWVLNHWKEIEDGFRVLCLNDAAWYGTDFSNRKTLAAFIGQDEDEEYDEYLVMSGFSKNGKAFAYDIKDNKAMQRMIKLAQRKNSTVGPVAFITYSDTNGEKETFEIRNLKLLGKAMQLADDKGKKLKVKAKVE